MWKISFCQQIGTGKKHNQDALFNGEQVFQYKLKNTVTCQFEREKLLLGVADGVSHSPQAQKASRYWMEQLANCPKLNPTWLRNQHQHFCQAFASSLFGTATTFVGAEIFPNGICHILNVGDSRAYHISTSGEWKQVSQDHTVLNDLQAGQNPEKFANLYAALSDCLIADWQEDQFRIHSAQIQLEQGDCLLLCSDGLTNGLSEEIRQAIWHKYTDIGQRLTAFRKAISQQRQHDDVSIVAVEFG
ncbi:hypothetical protein A4G20_08400 [Pasteurellaceae bacterium RH1A]|nr:hypothetical protein A4G20_08400 [Pasteurellaceae bacterium RH1A]